jgi:hypothetical protein
MRAKKNRSHDREVWGTLEATDHHFRVEIPRAKNLDVTISENFSLQDPDLPLVPSDQVKKRVILPKQRWDHIAAAVRIEFNERCKKLGSKTGSWQVGANDLPRSLGKELVVLAWAIEQAPEDKIPYAIQNWLGLSPEERWWLYTQANAATGHAEKGRGKGWRKAIQIALTENPIESKAEGSEAADESKASPRPRNAAELKKSLTIG